MCQRGFCCDLLGRTEPVVRWQLRLRVQGRGDVMRGLTGWSNCNPLTTDDDVDDAD
jgi:hypothetical protein